MNKKIKLFLIIFISVFTPLINVEAASYVVKNVSTSGTTTVGTYTNYASAKTAMNNQSSTSTNVATIYKDGKLVNAKYAIFKIKYSTSGSRYYKLYQNVSDTTNYTYITSEGAIDTAFLDYDDTYSRAKIKVSGFTGWIDLSAGTITPISLISDNVITITGVSVNVRSSYSTSSSSLGKCDGMSFAYTDTKVNGGYTWYKINFNGKTGWVAYSADWATLSDNKLETYYNDYSQTGNLIHHYDYYLAGGSVNNYFTNLGPSPSWMKKDGVYYSFDGNYFYESLLTMLDDYLNNRITNSENASNPHYPYYLYLSNKSKSSVTAAELDSQITNTSSKLYGQGQYFKEAEELYGMNALSAFATAKNESANGTSTLAKNKNNVFGYGAYDSCPYDCAKSYASVRDSIIDYAKNGLSSYMTAGATNYFGTHSGNKLSGRAVKYASDPYWGEKQAHNALITDKNQGYKDYLYNTIGVTANGKYNVSVYKDASTNTVLYKMQNKNTSFKLYDLSVTVIDKVNGFYKVYADSSDQYGYIKESDLYVSNNQPVITATDKTVQLGNTFNPLTGVTASDKENGNLTSKITYSGTVNTNVAGTYEITYSVKDNSNFNVSKTITVTVQGAPEPVITAADKEVSQYTDFDYLEGVSASDTIDGNITKNITYTGTVNTDVKGTYEIIYSVTNTNGKTKTKTITVTVVDNEKPIINAKNKVIYLGEEFNPLEGVTASDKEDGDITEKITYTGESNVTKVGTFEIVYLVEDKAKQKVTKTVTYTVEEKVLEEKDGWFHLEEISFNNDMMKISGFNIVSKINNSLNADIEHILILENQNTGDVIEFDLNRLTSPPFVPNDGTKNDYKGSWFIGNIQLENIPQGDYTMYIRTEIVDYYTKQIVSNIEYTDNITRKYKDSNNRGYLLKENQVLPSVDLELFVRDNGLISYGSTPVRSGVMSDFFGYDFIDGKLNLTGNSYALKTNYAKGTIVERKILLENKNTHKVVYQKDIGSIANGPYKISSNTNNDLTRAWFNNSIDLSGLDKGTYVIYIMTKVGVVEGYSELVDYAYTDLSKTYEIDGKKISLKRNENQRIRIELIIE